MQHAQIDEAFTVTKRKIDQMMNRPTFRLADMFDCDAELDFDELLSVCSKINHRITDENRRRAGRGLAAVFRTFVGTIRPFYCSDGFRKLIAKDQINTENRKRKFDEYQNNRSFREYACQKYRELALYAKDKFTGETDISPISIEQSICWLETNLQCEFCGRGSEDHRRPGLIVRDIIKHVEQLSFHFISFWSSAVSLARDEGESPV